MEHQIQTQINPLLNKNQIQEINRVAVQVDYLTRKLLNLIQKHQTLETMDLMMKRLAQMLHLLCLEEEEFLHLHQIDLGLVLCHPQVEAQCLLRLHCLVLEAAVVLQLEVAEEVHQAILVVYLKHLWTLIHQGDRILVMEDLSQQEAQKQHLRDVVPWTNQRSNLLIVLLKQIKHHQRLFDLGSLLNLNRRMEVVQNHRHLRVTNQRSLL